MKMGLIVPLLLLVFSFRVLAADPQLSLEDATKIAKERVRKDGLPEDRLVIRLIDLPQFRDKFYLVQFDPHIPDPTSKNVGTFIGYNIKMDGTIEKAVITETVSRVAAKATGMSETRFDAKKAGSSDLLNNPFTLQLNAGKTNSGANP